MARWNFDKLTVKELQDAQIEIAALIETKKAEELTALKAKMAELASASGFSVDELFAGSSNTVRKYGKVAPKYRNPADPSQLWSGRGRQPLWFIGALKKGVKADKLMIR